jgi:hypothetical protein
LTRFDDTISGLMVLHMRYVCSSGGTVNSRIFWRA